MATEFKCDYCPAVLDKNVTLVHTKRYHGLWDLDCSMCPDCFKHLKVVLEKAKSQQAWTGWTALEQEIASLKKETESLKSELQFLRENEPISDPEKEMVTVVASKGGKKMLVHRSILISRSAVFKTYLKPHSGNHRAPIVLPCVPTHNDSFEAFIQFLYTAELEPKILNEYAEELGDAGNKNAIEFLTRKCEDYIVNNMTAETTIKYLKLAERWKCTAITAAAVKQIQSDYLAFADREDFKALENDISLFGAFQYVMLDHNSRKEKPKGSDPDSGSGSVPGSDPSINSGLPRDLLRDRYEASFRPLGMCFCSVHPIAHAAHAAPVMSTGQ